jgi:hypothetical protein
MVNHKAVTIPAERSSVEAPSHRWAAWMLAPTSYLLLAGLLWMASVPCPAENVAVGVLRPTVSAPGNRLMDRIPEQYRAQARGPVEHMQKEIGDHLPGVVQRTWLEMLERKGIPAVALEAGTVEEGIKLPAASNVRWFLSTSVTGEMTQNSGVIHLPARTGAEETAKMTLTLLFALVDAAGHTVLIPREVVRVTRAAANGEPNPQDDLWAACGDQMILAIASAMPLGTVKYVDAPTLLPKPPDMSESVRFDVTAVEHTTYQGKTLPTAGDQRKSILEFAGRSITTQDRGMGMIYTPGAGRIFVVDDRSKHYSTMTAEDFAFMGAFARTETSQGEAAARLVQTEASGRTIRYKFVEAQDNDSRITTATLASREAETNVSIEYDEALPAWQSGVQELKQLFGGVGRWPIGFYDSSKDELSNSIWDQVVLSPAPPRRVVIDESVNMQWKKKKTEPANQIEVAFDRSQVARPMDLTIPTTYQWHTNLLLTFIWIP